MMIKHPAAHVPCQLSKIANKVGFKEGTQTLSSLKPGQLNLTQLFIHISHSVLHLLSSEQKRQNRVWPLNMNMFTESRFLMLSLSDSVW